MLRIPNPCPCGTSRAVQSQLRLTDDNEATCFGSEARFIELSACYVNSPGTYTEVFLKSAPAPGPPSYRSVATPAGKRVGASKTRRSNPPDVLGLLGCRALQGAVVLGPACKSGLDKVRAGLGHVCLYTLGHTPEVTLEVLGAHSGVVKLALSTNNDPP